MAQTEDNKIYQGQAKVLTLRLRDAADDPWDLTGKFIRARYKQSGVPVTKECTVSGDVLIGKVILTLLDSETVLFEEGDFVLDIAVGTFVSVVPADWATATDTIDQIWSNTGGFQVLPLGNGAIT